MERNPHTESVPSHSRTPSLWLPSWPQARALQLLAPSAGVGCTGLSTSIKRCSFAAVGASAHARSCSSKCICVHASSQSCQFLALRVVAARPPKPMLPALHAAVRAATNVHDRGWKWACRIDGGSDKACVGQQRPQQSTRTFTAGPQWGWCVRGVCARQSLAG